MQIKGTGLGFREKHFHDLLKDPEPVSFLELLVDNYLGDFPEPLRDVQKLQERYPLSFHSVGMNLASINLPDKAFLKELKKLSDHTQPFAVSDHLSWVRIGETRHHDLLPLPYTEESLEIVCRNIDIVQTELGREILVENPSRYIGFKTSEIEEATFMNEICRRTNCRLLLDVNNVYVTSKNMGEDPHLFLEEIETDFVKQFHLAGYEEQDKVLVDTHSRCVSQEVWDLFKMANKIFAPQPTVIEWDRDIPDFEEMKQESLKSKSIQESFHE